MMRHTKSFTGHAEVKDAEQGIAELLVSAYDVLDHDGDIVVKGATAKQIKGEYGPNPKGMLDHEWKMAMAVAKTLDWWEEDDGLHISAQFNLAKQVGREAFDDLRFFGEDCQFSVGYSIRESERAGEADRAKGIRRYIREWEISEWSVVMLGANDQTRLISAKGRDEKRRDVKAIVGSYELLTAKLREELEALIPSEYLWVHGTFDDHVVFDREYRTADGGYEYACYEIPYTAGEDGAFTFGEPVEVAVDEVVNPKMLTPAEVRAMEGMGEPEPAGMIPQSANDEFRLLVVSTIL